MSIGLDLFILLLCYLIGAIPTGLILGLKVKGIDVREHGSKNIGTTNVWRTLGWKLGLATFLIDVGKAFLLVFFAARAADALHAANEGLPRLEIFAGIAVLFGNFFNVFLGGKGGKGVATSLGVFLALAPIPVLISFALFGIVVGLSRLVSLASLAAAAVLPITTGYFHGFDDPLFWMVLVIALIVIFKHRTNIQRLMAGTESKVGKRR